MFVFIGESINSREINLREDAKLWIDTEHDALGEKNAWAIVKQSEGVPLTNCFFSLKEFEIEMKW